MEQSGRIDRGDGIELAWARVDGEAPTVLFLPGFLSDMAGTKATALGELCRERGHAYVRFDYSGHGASGGRFEDGTIGRWARDALAIIDAISQGPLVLVGSSMGAWIALLSALHRPARVSALIGVAAAPDFTEVLIWDTLTFAERARLMQDGLIHLPSQYGDPYPITRALIEDGRQHLLLGAPIQLHCPIRLLHGQRDQDVPWEMPLRIADQVSGDDVQVILVKDGDHRLSRPQDLALLRQTLVGLLDSLRVEDGS
ncbi:MAG: alpha/beta hydrolase [Acetobacteraceae bacterium]|nr:alpha/beta hydrolase [Acetobacteraceae bacterium]